MPAMTDDLAITVKDMLREIRYAARKEVRLLDRGQEALQALLLGADARPADGRPGRLYELSRRFANPVGRMAQRLFETASVASTLDENYLLPVSTSLAALAADENDTLFAGSVYRSGSSCLDKMGLKNVFMSEHSIQRAARPVAQRHAEWLQRPATNPERQTLIVADATQAIIAAQPIKRVDRDAQPAPALTLALADLNAHCFLTVGIATAVVSAAKLPADVSIADVMESAELVAAARYDRFEAALKCGDPASSLAREFSAVIPYLP
jgi:hypothetical protein